MISDDVPKTVEVYTAFGSKITSEWVNSGEDYINENFVPTSVRVYPIAVPQSNEPSHLDTRTSPVSSWTRTSQKCAPYDAIEYFISSIGGPDDVGEGNWLPTTSVDQYAATLARWFGVAPDALTTVFPNLGRYVSANLGFMA